MRSLQKNAEDLFCESQLDDEKLRDELILVKAYTYKITRSLHMMHSVEVMRDLERLILIEITTLEWLGASMTTHTCLQKNLFVHQNQH